MGHKNRRLDPVQPMIHQGKILKKRRSDPHRMHGRTNVMSKTRQSEFPGASSSSDVGIGLMYDYSVALVRESYSSRQPVRAGSHDNNRLPFRHSPILSKDLRVGPLS